MEPFTVFEYFFPVKVFGFCFCNCRVCTVVNTFRTTLACSPFVIIDSYTVSATNDVLCVYTITAEAVYGCLAYFVFWKLCNVI